MADILKQISIDPSQGVTLAHQLKQQLKWLIAGGLLQPGDRLPALRELARQLSINLHTVRSAYQMLEAEGLVESRRGRGGTRVLAIDPRRLAQSVAAQRTHTVGVIIPSWFNPFYHALLHGVAEQADEDRSLLFVCHTQDDPAEAWRYFLQLSARQVDGIIVVSHGVNDLLGADGRGAKQASALLPYVTVDWPACTGPAVLLDAEGAGYQATQHLLQHGHRRVGLITYAADLANIMPVNGGYRRALCEAGIQEDPALVARVSGFDLAAGAEGIRRLMALPRPPTAVFGITDLIAVGALQALKAMGRRVPRDIALVGFNDVPLAQLLDPPLTTVAAPAEQLGRRAMQMLQRLIEGKRLRKQRVILPTALVIRGSCGEHAVSSV